VNIAEVASMSILMRREKRRKGAEGEDFISLRVELFLR